ncbi:MAG: hypothetical protein V1903_07870 [Bacteroidota bacterium]
MKSCKVLFIFLLFILPLVSFAQNSDTTEVTTRFGATVTLTSKGISTIPNLSLGKPALLFDLTMGRKLSFDPMFRFSLEGKPWTFIFWFRYQVLNNNRFQLTVGAHPAFSYSTKTYILGEVFEDVQIVRRYVAEEVAPMYKFTKSISAGLYYLHANGIDPNTTKATNLVAVRANFSNIRLSEKLYMRINPQVYYLTMDGSDGFYINSTFALAIKNFPLSVSGLVNQPIKTDIAAGNELLWNVSLVYTFINDYVKK